MDAPVKSYEHSFVSVLQNSMQIFAVYRLVNSMHLRVTYGLLIERLTDVSGRPFALREERSDQLLRVLVAELFREVYGARSLCCCI